MLGSAAVDRGSTEPLPHWLNPGEEDEWDAFVAGHPQGLVYHYSAWRRMLEEAFHHIRGRVLVLRDSRTHAIVAGLPIYSVRSWLLGKRLVSIPFASLSDPLLSSEGDFERLWPRLRAACNDLGAVRIEVRARGETSRLANAPLVVSTRYKHHVLDISADEDQLFRRFAKTSICQRIRKAERAGVVVVDSDREQDVRVCYEILAQTRRRLSLPPMPFAFFEAMRRHLWPRRAKFLVGRHEGRPIACHIVLTARDMWISEYSGCVDGAIPGSNQLLYWQAIRLARARGAKAFSFGRTAVTNNGLLDYKRRWRTLEEDVVALASPNGHASGQSSVGIREDGVRQWLIRKAISMSPMSVCEGIGRFCYRHLG